MRSLLLLPLLFISTITCAPTYLTYDELYQQLQTKSPNATNQQQLIKDLLLMVPSYVFHTVSKDSTYNVDPSIAASVIPMTVDLTASLQSLALQASTYTSDADWQQAVADVFIPLHDAHTRYNKPAPYRYASYQQPIVLSTRTAALDDTHMYISPQYPLLSIYEEKYNTSLKNLTMYDGWEVTDIDGVNSFEAIWRFANESIGYTKDQTSRINLAINGYGDGKGYWAIRQQQAFGAPSRANVTYRLRNNGTIATITLNWLGVYAPPALADVHYIQKHATAKTELETIALASAYHMPTGTVKVNDASSGVSFKLYKDGQTGILKISTFSPASYPAFIAAIQESIVQHRRVAPNGKLIIDLRANGGGDICLGYATLRYIFPSLADGTVWPSNLYVGDSTGINGRYEMINSALFARLAAAGYDMQSHFPQNQTEYGCGTDPEKVGYTVPCAWYNPLNGLQYRDLSFLAGPTRTRGGSAQAYSRLIHEGCAAMWQQWTPATHTPYSPDNVLLMSDGLCGSTCSVFSSYVQQHALGKTLVFSPVQLNVPQQFWSFPGGEVETIDYIRTLATRYQLENDTLTPQTLPDGATFRFAIRQIYPWNIQPLLMPLEFIHVPAHFQTLYDFSYNDTDAIYDRAYLYLAICVAGVGDDSYPCNVAHGTGYLECNFGGRTSTCIVDSCQDGYYYVNQTGKTGQCVECPFGTYRTANDTSAQLNACSACTNAVSDDELSTSSSVSCSTSYTRTGVSHAQCPYTVDCSESTRNSIIIGASAGIGSAILVGGLVFCLMNNKIKRQQGLDESLLGH